MTTMDKVLDQLRTRVWRLLDDPEQKPSEIERALAITRQRLFRSEQRLNTHQEDALVREAARYLRCEALDRTEFRAPSRATTA